MTVIVATAIVYLKTKSILISFLYALAIGFPLIFQLNDLITTLCQKAIAPAGTPCLTILWQSLINGNILNQGAISNPLSQTLFYTGIAINTIVGCSILITSKGKLKL